MSDRLTTCKACLANTRLAHDSHLVWHNELWVLRHTKPPYAVLGWMTLHSRRHASAFMQMTTAELSDLGPTIAKISEAIIDATGALRVYIASMTETMPHFHAHLVPHYEGGPKGWETFKLKDLAKVSPPDISDEAVKEVIQKVATWLAD